jgi:hypothetical protein
MACIGLSLKGCALGIIGKGEWGETAALILYEELGELCACSTTSPIFFSDQNQQKSFFLSPVITRDTLTTQ